MLERAVPALPLLLPVGGMNDRHVRNRCEAQQGQLEPQHVDRLPDGWPQDAVTLQLCT